MISPTTIDAVKSLPILDVVTRYDIQLKKQGTNWRGTSPWRKEKTPSFFVVPSKNIFKDFSTGKGGDPVAFVMHKDGVEWIDAVKSLCEQHGITIEYEKTNGKAAAPEKVTANREALRVVLDWAVSHFCANPVPGSFTRYRAFPEEVQAAFRVGYALPAWDDLLNQAAKAGHSTEVLLQAGLVKKSDGGKVYDAFRDRIMFPVFDYRGNVVAFSGRDAETQTPKDGDEKPPKYINSPETCYDKSHHLFGLYQAIKGGKLESGAYLVEGQTDVMRMHLHGITNTVAPCGSAFTEQQAKLLKRFTDRLVIVPDNDADKEDNPGLKALERNATVAIKAGFTVKVLIPGR